MFYSKSVTFFEEDLKNAAAAAERDSVYRSAGLSCDFVEAREGMHRRLTF